ncbi:MAG: transketolase, partial [Mesorhizobium sp.]
PSLIACRTVIGKGAPNLSGSEKTHGAPLGLAEIEATRANIGWTYPPFELPDTVMSAWRAVAIRGEAARTAWERRHQSTPQREAFDRAIAGEVPAEVFEALASFRSEHFERATAVAT